MLFKCQYASFMSTIRNSCVFLEIIDSLYERICFFWNILPFRNSSASNLIWLIVYGFDDFSKKKNIKDSYLHTSKIFSSKNLCFYFITPFFSLLRFHIKLMSFIESIAEQDSLLQNSEVQYFINSYRKQSLQIAFRKASVLQFPTQIIPKSKMKILPRKPWETTQQTVERSKSSIMMRRQSLLTLNTSRVSKMSIVNPETNKIRAFSSLTQRKSMAKGKKDEKNQNIISSMQKIQVKKIIVPKLQNKLVIPLGLRQSRLSLRPKTKVETQRMINKKYQRDSPFAPDYLESEYLQ